MTDLSIVIPTRNRARLLQATLASILSQTLSKDNYEVIVVDNGSSDNTRAVCEDYDTRFVNFTYLFDARPGLHIGRNLGFLTAKSKILVYVDDDIEVAPDWLISIKNTFESDQDIALVGGNILPNWETPPPQWIKNWWGKTNKIPVFSIINLGKIAKEISSFDVYGCNFSVKREIVAAANGFHPDGMPEHLMYKRGDGETHLSNYIAQNNYKTYFNPQCSIKHYVSKDRMTYHYIKKWYRSSGITSCFTLIRKDKGLFNIITFIKILLIGLRNAIGFVKILNLKLSFYSFLGFLMGINYYRSKLTSNTLKVEWIVKESYF
jgi:glycosyltransferase involved in cell wall biosynthesis